MVHAHTFCVRIAETLGTLRDWLRCGLILQGRRFHLSFSLRIWLIATIAGALGVLLLELRQYLAPLLWLDDVPVSNLRQKEIGPAISEWWQRYKNNSHTVIVADRPFEIKISELGYQVDVAATTDRVLRAKNSGIWRLHQDYKSGRIAPVARLDAEQLDAAIDAWDKLAILDHPSSATLNWGKGTIIALPGKSGWVVDRKAARARILTDLLAMGRDALMLPTIRIEPKPDAQTLELLRQQAESLVKFPVLFESPQPPFKIHFSRSDLGHLLKLQNSRGDTFQVEFDAEALGQLLHLRHIPLDWPAKNATLAVAHSNQFVMVPESPGYHLSTSKFAARLLETAQNSSHRGIVEIESGESAKLKSTDVAHLGIHELMGSFTTRHPCCQPRVNNIHRIADLLDGVIVLPGATFSVNDTIGPRGIANGFVLAPSIEDGEMVETIGGGVSQFATTFYNALLRAGLEIVERRAHTYWFDRYPMGHEATLSIPKPDLVFRNDTHAGVLIKTEYTDKSITVHLYGDLEKRKVSFGISSVQEIEQPPVERLPNSDLSPEKERTKSGGRIGWSVMTWRTVTLANGEQKKDERKVTYKPQLRRVEVHPCRLKPDEPGYTGESCPKVEPVGEEKEE